jgi:hypothetical protein
MLFLDAILGTDTYAGLLSVFGMTDFPVKVFRDVPSNANVAQHVHPRAPLAAQILQRLAATVIHALVNNRRSTPDGNRRGGVMVQLDLATGQQGAQERQTPLLNAITNILEQSGPLQELARSVGIKSSDIVVCALTSQDIADASPEHALDVLRDGGICIHTMVAEQGFDPQACLALRVGTAFTLESIHQYAGRAGRLGPNGDCVAESNSVEMHDPKTFKTRLRNAHLDMVQAERQLKIFANADGKNAPSPETRRAQTVCTMNKIKLRGTQQVHRYLSERNTCRQVVIAEAIDPTAEAPRETCPGCDNCVAQTAGSHVWWTAHKIDDGPAVLRRLLKACCDAPSKKAEWSDLVTALTGCGCCGGAGGDLRGFKHACGLPTTKESAWQDWLLDALVARGGLLSCVRLSDEAWKSKSKKKKVSPAFPTGRHGDREVTLPGARAKDGPSTEVLSSADIPLAFTVGDPTVFNGSIGFHVPRWIDLSITPIPARMSNAMSTAPDLDSSDMDLDGGGAPNVPTV